MKAPPLILMKVLLPVALLNALCTADVARADLEFDLSPTPIQSVAGQAKMQVYTATLTNTFDYPLYLNGDILSVDPPLSSDDSAFQNYFVFPTDSDGNLLDQPTIDPNGGTLTLPIFSVGLPDSAPSGQYGGSFTIEGGQTPFDYDTLALSDFLVNVIPSSGVPEPGTLALLGGLAVGSLLLRRRRRILR